MNDDLGQGSYGAAPRDRQRPLPGDPEAQYYGTTTGSGTGNTPYSNYGYGYPYAPVQQRSRPWVKWAVIALAILFAIPILKFVFGLLIAGIVMITVFAGLSLAALVILAITLVPVALFVIGGVVLARYLLKPHPQRL
jgi:hypothetical protein